MKLIPYIFVIGIVLYVYVILAMILNKRNLNKVMAIVCGIAIITMIGLRHPSMGIDLGYGRYYGYLSSYEILSEMKWKYVITKPFLNYEVGYRLFNRFLGMFNLDIQSFLFICAGISIAPILYIIYKYSESSIVSYMIYIGLPVFQLLYSGLRQDIAIGLCVLSLVFVIKKKLVPFLIIVIIAFTFHSSAIIFLISYPLYHFKVSKSQRILSCVCLIPVYIFKTPLFLILSKIFKDDISLDNNGAITLFILFVLVYVFCTIYNDESKMQNGLLNLFYVACLCQAFGGLYSVAIRVGYYFMISLILLLPNLLRTMCDSKEKVYYNLVIPSAFFTFGLYSIYHSSWSMAYPYNWFWESM